MLAFLLLARAVAHQSGTLTLTERGARVPVVLQQIASKTGLALKANHAFDDRVLCISVHDASIEKTLSQIATVLDGEWRVTASTRTLAPSLSKARRAQNKLDDVQQAMIVTAIEQMRKDGDTDHDYDIAKLKAAQEADTGTKTNDDYSPVGPNARLLTRLLSLIPRETLGRLRQGDRIVFSNIPNHMQEGFGDGIDEILGQYRRESAIMKSLGIAESESASQNSDKPHSPSDLPSVIKVDLCLELTSKLGAYVRVFDAKGVEIESTNQDINFTSLSEDDGKAEVATLDGQDGGIVADPEFKALRQFYTTTPSAPFELPKNVKVDPAWFAKTLDPTGYEQVGVIQGSRWLEVANRLGVDVIGCPSDGLQEFIVHELRDQEAYPQGFFARGLLRSQMDDRCLLLKPADSFAGEAIVDRQAFRNLLKDAVNDSGASIPSVSRYVTESHGTDPLWLWDVIFLNQVLRQDGMGGNSYSRLQVLGLRLYGTLSAEQQQLLHRGPLPFKSLSPATLDWLHRDIFGASEITGPPKQEPTELFPNGLLPNGLMRITDEHNELVVAPVAEAMGQTVSVFQAMTAMRLGEALAGDLGYAFTGDQVNPARTIKKFRLGHRHSFVIQIDYAPNYTRRILLSETTYAPKRFITLEELPADFKRSVEEARVKRAREIKEIQDGLRSRQENPPPPI